MKSNHLARTQRYDRARLQRNAGLRECAPTSADRYKACASGGENRGSSDRRPVRKWALCSGAPLRVEVGGYHLENLCNQYLHWDYKLKTGKVQVGHTRSDWVSAHRAFGDAKAPASKIMHTSSFQDGPIAR
ncbi:hypothetical protein DFH09DRAFT_1100894 [Mycena vulgaris]|nr:hypothetical protein DFH09DRAFT_1100894 [Mycena vulgaris]